MRVKIMEYNVQDLFLHLAYPITAEQLNDLSEEQWQYYARDGVILKPLAKLRAIADLLRREAPDIVGLTEVGGLDSLQNFLTLFLPDLYEAYVTPGQSERGIENAFLVKKEWAAQASIKSHRNWIVPFYYTHELNPEAHENLVLAAQYSDLGKPEERTFSRDVPLLVLRQGKRKPWLALLLAHLKSGFDVEGFDPEGKVRRAAEFQALLKIADSLPKDWPLIMLGDFNGRASRHGTSSEFQPLYQGHDWEDVLEVAHIPVHERHTHVSFVSRQLQSSQLDYIFLRGDLKKAVVKEESRVYRYRFESEAEDGEIMVPFSFRERAQLPSDHYPLICVLDLAPQAPSSAPE